MAQEITIKRGDTAPPIAITCLSDGAPKNLTGATQAKLLIGTIDAAGVPTAKISAPMSFDADRSTGKVYYAWDADDLDTAGDYKLEVEVTWADATKQTFPEDSYLLVHVIADLG